MFSAQRLTTRLYPSAIRVSTMMTQLGDLGSGAGKGGGGGGSIREAGGAFGRMEAAREEEFFYKKSQQQLHRMKENQIDQQHWHESQIREHELAINRHREFLKKMADK